MEHGIWNVDYKKLPKTETQSIQIKAKDQEEASRIAHNLLVVGNYKDREVEGIEILNCSRVQ